MMFDPEFTVFSNMDGYDKMRKYYDFSQEMRNYVADAKKIHLSSKKNRDQHKQAVENVLKLYKNLSEETTAVGHGWTDWLSNNE